MPARWRGGPFESECFVPVLLAGYLFGVAAIASALSGIWGWTTALALVAVSQLALGGVGVGVSLKRLRESNAFERTSVDAADNLRGTVAAVSSPHAGDEARSHV